jgi:4-hydroxybenzoate polyprenyltransferase
MFRHGVHVLLFRVVVDCRIWVAADLLSNRSYNLQTIPVMVGKKGAFNFCVILLCAGLLPLIGLYGISTNFLSMALTALCTGALAYYAERQNSEYY